MPHLARIRLIIRILTVVVLFAVAAPGMAQERNPDGSPNPNASVVNEQTLLNQDPRIEGWIAIPNETASVLMQPAGRRWDYFHAVLLHWGGAVVVLALL